MPNCSRGTARRIAAALLLVGIVVASSFLATGSLAATGPTPSGGAPRVLVSLATGEHLDVAEGGDGDLYSLVLASRPTSDVTVDIESLGGDLRVTPNSVDFDSANWSTGQVVRVEAVDDGLDETSPERDVLLHATTSDDPIYDAAATEDVAVDVVDDDDAGVRLLGTVFAVEGGSDGEFEVRLSTRPSAPVDIAFDAQQVRTGSASIRIEPEDWDSPHVVAVTAIEDGISEGRHAGVVSARATSADPAYVDLVPSSIAVEIDDAGTAASTPWRDGRMFTMSTPAAGGGVIVTPPPTLTMDEVDPSGTIQSFQVRLATAPIAPVTVQLANNGQLGFLTSPFLTFDATNWYVDRTLTVMAIADSTAEPLWHDGIVSMTVTSTDPDYSALGVPPLTFSIHDADSAAATLVCSAGDGWNLSPMGRLVIDEGDAAGATCRIQVGSAPSQDLSFDIAVSLGSALVVDRPTVVIPAGSSAPEPIRIFAIADDVAEPMQSGTISFDLTTSDPVYALQSIPSVPVDLVDDDFPGVLIDPSGPIAIREGGPSEPISVKLSSQPVGDVTLSLSVGPEATVSTSMMVFTPSNWNVAQTAAVTAVDDYLDEPDPIPGQLVVAIASTDALYDGLGLQQVAMPIGDNDVAEVVVAATGAGTSLAEGGASDTVNLSLGTQPSSPVTVSLTTDGNVTATPMTLVFTPADWNVPQLVTLTAVQDLTVEGPHTSSVTLGTDSIDGAYATGATPSAPIVTSIVDDDVAGVKVTETEGATAATEPGQTDTFSVVLTARPLSDVVLATDGAGQLTMSPAELTFTPANWETAQTITVAAVQDSLDEPDPHTALLKLAVRTTAAGWGALTVPDITVKVADDDTASIDVLESGGSTKVTEGAKTGDEITVKLSSQPAASVSVAVKGDPQLKIDPAPLVLTAENWKAGLTYEVQAKDDADVESDHQGTLSFVVTTTDATYRAATTPKLTIGITDNDEDRGLTGGTGENDDDETTIMPREDEESEGTKTSTGGSGGGAGGVTSDGSGRTTEGTTRTTEGEERTDEGAESIDIPASAGDGAAGDDPEEPVEDLQGEVVSAAEEEKPAATKRKGPSLVAKATKFGERHWKVIAPIAGLGMVLSAAGAFFMNGDPIKTAQRGMAAKGAVDVARRAAQAGSGIDGDTRRIRRFGSKKRRQGPDDVDDGDGPGARGS